MILNGFKIVLTSCSILATHAAYNKATASLRAGLDTKNYTKYHDQKKDNDIKLVRQPNKDFQFKRQETDPDITIDPKFVNFDIRKYSPDVREKYEEFMHDLDKTIGQVALEYSREEGSIISEFAANLSRRYLQLIEAYAAMQVKFSIPSFINIYGGSLKTIGLTHQELLNLMEFVRKPGYQNIEIINEELREQNLGDNDFYRLWELIINQKLPIVECGGEMTIEQLKGLRQFTQIQSIFDSLNQKDKNLLKKTFLLALFRHNHFEDIFLKLRALSKSSVSNSNQHDRIIREISQRVVDFDAILGFSPFGALGTNVLAIINVVKKGDPAYPVSEFRNRLYFVYMLNDLVNEIILLPEEKFDEINRYLETHFHWIISPDLVEYLKNRRQDINYIPPLFRYGAQADLNNKGLRTMDPCEGSNNTPQDNTPQDPNIFSQREKIAIYGNPEQKNAIPISIYSGMHLFKVEKDPQKVKNENAKKHIELVQKLGLPMLAGISGTLDQSLTMAAIVGLVNSKEDLKKIRFSYIAFMVFNRDHTVHEILQSSKSFGLSYDASPLIHYQVLDKEFAKKVDHLIREKYGMGAEDYISKILSKAQPFPLKTSVSPRFSRLY